jgi:hypothetical protein
VARTKTPTSRAARKPRRPKVDQLAQDDAAASAAGVVVSARQERFALEYSIDGNGAGAARRSGYSKPSARHIAYELLRRPAVLERVRHYQAQHAAGSQFNRDALLRELGNVAYASLRDVVEIKGGRILLRKDADIPPEAWPAIAEISETKDRRIRVKLHPEMQAIDFPRPHVQDVGRVGRGLGEAHR